jgi:hypothetical protein
MPKFVITISVDAHVHYSTVVEADTPELAKQFARDHEDELKWHDEGTSKYDERDWDNIEPEKVDDAFLLQTAGLEPRPLHAASSRNLNPIQCLRLTASGRRAP